MGIRLPLKQVLGHIKVNEAPVQVSRIIQAPLDSIWKALTVHDEIIQWYFDNIPTFRPVVGFKTTLAVQSEDRTFIHLWEVTQVEPKQKISYRWTYKEYPGDSKVHFKLNKTNAVIKATVKTGVLKDFPDGIPEFKRESSKAGWNYFMDRLKNYVEK